MVAHDDHFALAVKAGNNGESHNHNDVGSVTLYKDGRPVLIDIGVETYTNKTFSADRYDIWTMQSAWHNLPTFEGVMQRDGTAFAARDVEVDLARAATMSMDIAGAYPPEAGLRSYRRTVTLTKGQGVEIEDVHDGDRAAELTLMFAEEPTSRAVASCCPDSPKSPSSAPVRCGSRPSRSPTPASASPGPTGSVACSCRSPASASRSP